MGGKNTSLSNKEKITNQLARGVEKLLGMGEQRWKKQNINYWWPGHVGKVFICQKRKAFTEASPIRKRRAIAAGYGWFYVGRAEWSDARGVT